MNNSDDQNRLYQRDSGVAHLLDFPRKPDVDRPKALPQPMPDLYKGAVALTRPADFIEHHFSWSGMRLVNWEKIFSLSEDNADNAHSVVAPIILSIDSINGKRPNSNQTLYTRANTRTEDDLKSVFDSYQADDTNEVRTILSKHPNAINLLLEARFYLAEFFGKNITLRLQLVPADENGGGPTLFANVHTNDDPLKAFEQISNFDESWWLDASDRSDGFLNFGVEFV